MTKKVNLKIIQWNMRSIKSNQDSLTNLITKEDPDVIALNETWLKAENMFSLKTGQG